MKLLINILTTWDEEHGVLVGTGLKVHHTSSLLFSKVLTEVVELQTVPCVICRHNASYDHILRCMCLRLL